MAMEASMGGGNGTPRGGTAGEPDGAPGYCGRMASSSLGTFGLGAVLVVGLFGVFGAMLLVLGLRGRRVDDHPVCRGCGFDLVGVYPVAARCPECGRSLDRRRAVRVGARRRRPLAIASGGLALAVVVAGVGLVGWGVAAGFDWNTIKPAWMLLDEAESGRAGASDRALAELSARVGDGRLAGRAADRVIERALAMQGDESSAWTRAWGDLLGRAWGAGLLSDAQVARFVTQAFVADFTVRERVHAGGQVPVWLEVRSRAGSGDLGVMGTAVFDAMSVGESVGDGTFRFSFMLPGSGSSSGMGGTAMTLAEAVGPGVYDARLPVRVEFVERGRPDVVIGAIEHEYVRRLEVVAPDEPLVTMVTDATLLDGVSGELTAILTEGPRRRHIALDVGRLPIAIAGEVVLLAGGEEVELGTVSRGADNPVRYRMTFGVASDVDLGGAVVEIRPSSEVALRTTDLVEIWGETIELPITREGSGP